MSIVFNNIYIWKTILHTFGAFFLHTSLKTTTRVVLLRFHKANKKGLPSIIFVRVQEGAPTSPMRYVI